MNEVPQAPSAGASGRRVGSSRHYLRAARPVVLLLMLGDC
jgi:hypothetical protein